MVIQQHIHKGNPIDFFDPFEITQQITTEN